MAYATATDIVEEFKRLDIESVDSIMTTAKVERFIDESSAEIDIYLSAKYETPITGSTSLLFLKKICIDLVAFRLVKIISIKKAVPASNDAYQEILEGRFYNEAMEKLKMLAYGKLVLPDAVSQGSASIRSYNVANDTEPVFRKDERQW